MALLQFAAEGSESNSGRIQEALSCARQCFVLRSASFIAFDMMLGLLLSLTVALAACGRPTAQSAAGTGIRITHLPPGPKDVLEALMRSSEVSLSVDKSCTS